MFKVFSKMGISTIQSYRGAQVFEAVGLDDDLVENYFTGTSSRISGIGLNEIAQETLLRHKTAIEETPDTRNILPVGGFYNWRRRGEYHQINPVMTNTLQKAVRTDSKDAYDEFSLLVNEQNHRFSTPRDLLVFKESTPIKLKNVEPASEIVKRFVTGAMSLGSISKEAHETLAVAMNSIGARSNSGEGGEDSSRYVKRKK